MKLYEYNDAIAEAMNRAMQGTVDAETGELLMDENGEPIIDFSEIETLEGEYKEKVHSISGYYLEMIAEIDAMKAAENGIKARRTSKERAAKRLFDYIDKYTEGQNFEFPEYKVSHKTSQAVEVDEEFLRWARKNGCQFIRTKEEPDKVEISHALKAGKKLPYARFVDKNTLQIKGTKKDA